jgi:hypothetical protein
MMKIIITEEQYKKVLEESHWLNTVGDILGILDPSGLVDMANGISYMYQGEHLFGILSFVSAFPFAGDIVAKPVMGALKIGSAATKELKVAMDLAKAGKTIEASASMAKLAKEPGVVGKFLRNAESWAPKIAEKVETLPGGLLKGFKNTILDYLKLFERAGAKSAKVAIEAGKLAKDVVVTPAKQIQNIKALQDIIKTEKIFDAAALTKRSIITNIFMGGAPRLFGNRRMRMLMRSTKLWLGFLDYIGLGNFVGPDELAKTLGSEEEMIKKMDEFMKTEQARNYAQQDFGTGQLPNQEVGSIFGSTLTTPTQQSGGANPFGDFLANVFQAQIAKAAIAAL